MNATIRGMKLLQERVRHKKKFLEPIPPSRCVRVHVSISHEHACWCWSIGTAALCMCVCVCE